MTIFPEWHIPRSFVARSAQLSAVTQRERNKMRYLNWTHKNFHHSLILSIIAFAIVVFSILFSLRNAPNNFDLVLYDETSYLLRGIDYSHDMMDDYEYGPLYSLFYRLLSIFYPNAIDLYLNAANILLFTTFLTVFFCFIVISGSMFFSILAFGIILLSGAANIWPRVSFAAITIIAFSLIIATLQKNAASCFAILMFGAYLASFVRPEFVLAFYILIFCTATALFYQRANASNKFDLLVMWFSIGGVLILSLFWCFPLLKPSTRAFEAFGAHFALRVVRDNNLQTDPWVNWREITLAYFPNASSITDAFRAKPVIFFKFITANSIDLIKTWIHTYVVQPIVSDTGHPSINWIHPRLIWFTMVALFLAKGVFHCVHARLKQNNMLEVIRYSRLAIIIFLVPVVISCVLIFPRDHYTIILVFLLFSLLATFVRTILDVDDKLLSVAAAATLFINTPVLARIPQPTLELVRRVQAGPAINAMLEIDGGWCTYLVPRCHTLYAFDVNGEDLRMLVEENKIDSIFISPRLMSYAPLVNKEFFQSLLMEPETYGWYLLKLDKDHFLLIRKA